MIDLKPITLKEICILMGEYSQICDGYMENEKNESSTPYYALYHTTKKEFYLIDHSDWKISDLDSDITNVCINKIKTKTEYSEYCKDFEIDTPEILYHYKDELLKELNAELSYCDGVAEWVGDILMTSSWI